MLKAYGMKFRYKGDKNYIHGVFFAKTEEAAAVEIRAFIKDSNIDKRTVTWAGASSPLAQGGEPLFIYGDIVELG